MPNHGLVYLFPEEKIHKEKKQKNNTVNIPKKDINWLKKQYLRLDGKDAEKREGMHGTGRKERVCMGRGEKRGYAWEGEKRGGMHGKGRKERVCMGRGEKRGYAWEGEK